jgi:hypothetical protein
MRLQLISRVAKDCLSDELRVRLLGDIVRAHEEYPEGADHHWTP